MMICKNNSLSVIILLLMIIFNVNIQATVQLSWNKLKAKHKKCTSKGNQNLTARLCRLLYLIHDENSDTTVQLFPMQFYRVVASTWFVSFVFTFCPVYMTKKTECLIFSQQEVLPSFTMLSICSEIHSVKCINHIKWCVGLLLAGWS